MAKPPIDDIMRALMSQDGNVIPFPSGRARPPASSVPPISQDPWFDDLLEGLEDGSALDDVSGELPDTPLDTFLEARNTARQNGQPLPAELFVWATSPTGKRVRVDGPFANELEAQRALRDMNKTGMKLKLDIGPMPG